MEMLFLAPLPPIDRTEQEWNRVAVEIEEYESATCVHILLCAVAHEGTLAAPGLSENGDVHRSAAITQLQMPLRDLAVRNPESEIEAPAFFPHPRTAFLQAVPNSRNEFFEEMNHEQIVRG